MSSDGTKTKRVEFVIAAKDEASRVVKQATANIKKELAAASSSRGSIPLAGAPSERVQLAFPKPNRSAQEQQIRDMMAGRIRGMRESARRGQMYDEVTRRMFGQAEDLSGIGKELFGDPNTFLGRDFFGSGAGGGRGGSAGGRGAGKGGGTQGELSGLRGLKHQLKPLEDVGKLLRGAGAIGAVGLITSTLADAPGGDCGSQDVSGGIRLPGMNCNVVPRLYWEPIKGTWRLLLGDGVGGIYWGGAGPSDPCDPVGTYWPVW